MGFYYAFHLYYKPEQIESALREVAKWADVPWTKRSTLSVSGRIIDVPFTSDFQAKNIVLSEDPYPALDTSLWFPQDSYSRSENWKTRKTPKGTEVLIGYIYLLLRLDSNYCEFAFIAATSDMSAYFARSQTVHKQFLKFAQRTQAIATLFFDECKEGHSFALVSDMKRRIHITTEPLIGLPHISPDLIVEQALAQLNESAVTKSVGRVS